MQMCNNVWCSLQMCTYIQSGSKNALLTTHLVDAAVQDEIVFVKNVDRIYVRQYHFPTSPSYISVSVYWNSLP